MFQLGEATQKTTDECLNKLKVVTRRYAKKQKRWIENRLQAVPAPIYRFDASSKASTFWFFVVENF